MSKGDLISRSNFEKNILNAFENKLNEHDANLLVEFLDYLDDEPTAYDVDEVEKEVRNLLCKGCKAFNCSECNSVKVIETVMVGGIE